MDYKFKCTKCRHIEQKDIPMSDYSKLKDSQVCSKCGAKTERVIEWTGMAEGSGDGWYGKSDGSQAI